MMAEYLGDGIISIKSDVDEAMKFFQNMNVSEKSISKAMLRAVGKGGNRAIRKGYRAVLNKRTGKLYKSIRFTPSSDGKKGWFYNTASSGKRTAKDGRDARYGYMLASGYTIEPKMAHKWLTFMADGKWHKVKQVRVNAKDYTEGPIDRYMASGDCDRSIDKELQKQIKKIERKLGVNDGQ